MSRAKNVLDKLNPSNEAEKTIGIIPAAYDLFYKGFQLKEIEKIIKEMTKADKAGQFVYVKDLPKKK